MLHHNDNMVNHFKGIIFLILEHVPINSKLALYMALLYIVQRMAKAEPGYFMLMLTVLDIRRLSFRPNFGNDDGRVVKPWHVVLLIVCKSRELRLLQQSHTLNKLRLD